MMFLTSRLVVCIAFGVTVHATQCSTANLLTIASNPHLEGCKSKVGFDGFSSYSGLTAEQIKEVCDSDDCVALMEDIRLMDFNDCVIEGTDLSLKADILDPFDKACGGGGSIDSSSSSIGDVSAGSTTSGSSSLSSATMLSIFWLSTAVAVLVFQ